MDVPSRSRSGLLTVRMLSVLCLVFLLVSAGCSAGTLTGPSSQQGPVGLNVTNTANVTHTFEVSVIELPANATVQWSDGETGTVDLGAGGIASNDPGEYYEITEVELPSSAHLHGQYTLESGEANISNISTSNLSKNFAVVFGIHHDDHVVSWVSSTCDGDLVGLKVISRYSGSSSTYDCDEGAF